MSPDMTAAFRQAFGLHCRHCKLQKMRRTRPTRWRMTVSLACRRRLYRRRYAGRRGAARLEMRRGIH